jgi:peptidoglycan/xylan/chitin deacetylase (PgdA/CDA1 family)
MIDAVPARENAPKTNVARQLVSIPPWADPRPNNEAGYCGTSTAHCRSPDCQVNFGRCDASKRPNGPPTTEVPRPQDGKAAYGPETIRRCSVPGTVALTFDDGPNRYTGDLLNLLDKYDAKATFFITGINNGKGAIDDHDLPWEPLIARMEERGHQIASHTWSHHDLGKASHSQLREEMFKNEAALRNILGKFPAYMRPPYSSCGRENGCLEEMGALGYHIVLFDIDSRDYSNDSPDKIQVSKDVFDNALDSAKPSEKSWLVIAHDVHEQTVHNLTEHMLKRLLSDGYRPVTVGECLGDPKEFWYRKDSHGPHRGQGTKGPLKELSKDGTCGGNVTCAGSGFGACCSWKNLCGDSTAHCGTGCQIEFGECVSDIPDGNPSTPHEGDGSGSSGSDQKKTKGSKSEAYSVFRLGVGPSVLGLMAVSAATVLLV